MVVVTALPPEATRFLRCSLWWFCQRADSEITQTSERTTLAPERISYRFGLVFLHVICVLYGRCFYRAAFFKRARKSSATARAHLQIVLHRARALLQIASLLSGAVMMRRRDLWRHDDGGKVSFRRCILPRHLAPAANNSPAGRSTGCGPASRRWAGRNLPLPRRLLWLRHRLAIGTATRCAAWTAAPTPFRYAVPGGCGGRLFLGSSAPACTHTLPAITTRRMIAGGGTRR